MELLLIMLIIGAILIFALIGFVSVIARVIGAGSETNTNSSRNLLEPDPQPTRPSIATDVIAARRLIEYLASTQKIPKERFLDLCNYLDKNFPQEVASSPFKSHLALQSYERDPLSQANEIPVAELLKSPSQSTELVDLADGKMATANADSASFKSGDQSGADLVTSVEVLETGQDSLRLPRPSEAARPASAAGRPDPWNQPDPPAPPPRRSLSEMIAGFMQENNMRWGELASGILIVLSAIGLVLSLRNELNSRIPYFSSLLFLFITAAIIGSGIYTLQRWKLRNTSRGTLVIGLLLIPLNFAAACILSSGDNRRELSDPWYWTAILVGMGGLGSLSWFGSRYLLRRFNCALTTCLIGCGAATLVYHRLAESTDFAGSSLQIATALLPAACFLIIGSSFLSLRRETSRHVSRRQGKRWIIQFGISVFAALTAAAIWLFPSERIWQTSIAISPMLVVTSLLVSALGFALSTTDLRLDQSGRKVLASWLIVLGLMLALLFALGSLANPTIFAVNAFVIGIGVGLTALQRRIAWLTALSWSALAAGGLIALNLWMGKLELDTWIEPTAIQQAILDGKSGLFLLVWGMFAAGVQGWIALGIGESRLAQAFRRTGWITGGAVFLAGCILAVAASLLHRQNRFDTMTASSLLLVGGLGATLISVLLNRSRELLQAENRKAAFFESLPFINLAMLALFLMLAGLIHAFVWNPDLASWLSGVTRCGEAPWAWICVVHGVFFAIAARIERPGADDDVFSLGSAVSLVAATIAAIVIVSLHTGNSTFVLVLASAGWFILGLTFCRNGKFCIESTLDAGVPFVASTAVLVSIATAEWIMPPAWGANFGVRHLMLQAIALSAWAAVWTILSSLLPRFSLAHWLVSALPRVEQILMPHLVSLMTGFFIGAMVELSQLELFSNVGQFRSLQTDWRWVIYALVAMWMSVWLMNFQHPSWVKGVSLIALWFVSWGLLAINFQPTRATASALRWLIPGSGLTLALFISARRHWMPVWLRVRRLARMRGRSWWDRWTTQRLIDLIVFIVVISSLSISTITVSQVMLSGPNALGGPLAGSFFAKDKIISFGVPLILVVGMLLSFAISERRPRLAAVGSYLFQYLAILATVLLILSPHPKLATDYFIKVLHSTAMGMSIFGLTWHLFRKRIHGSEVTINESEAHTEQTPSRQVVSTHGPLSVRARPLETHTLINGILLSALAIVAITRYFLVPAQSAGWISSIGNGFGWACLAGFGLLAWMVSTPIRKGLPVIGRLWPVSWIGAISIGFFAASVDYFSSPFQPWLSFRVISFGFVALGLVQLALLRQLRVGTSVFNPAQFDLPTETGNQSGMRQPQRALAKTIKAETHKVPFLVSMGVSLLFAIGGIGSPALWQYESIGLLIAIIAVIFVGGVVLRQTWLLFVSAATSLVATGAIVDQGLLPGGQPSWLNLSMVALSILALANIGSHRLLKDWRGETVPPRFVLLANIATLAGSLWLLLGSLLQTQVPLLSSFSYFCSWLGLVVFIAVAAVIVAQLWNASHRFWTVSFATFTLAVGLNLAVLAGPERNDLRAAFVFFSTGAVVFFWGLFWISRFRWGRLTQALKAEGLESLIPRLQQQLPLYAIGVTTAVIPVCYWLLCVTFDERTTRLLAASVPILLAAGFACLSNGRERRWLQHLSLVLVTVGGVFLSWIELDPNPNESDSVRYWMRIMIVLALAMFIYGGLIPRWVRIGDQWLKTFREMAMATCAVAIVCLASLLYLEWRSFDRALGAGVGLVEAVMIAVMGLGMVYGLIAIAVRPMNDPFSLSLNGRKTYVYLAQAVLVALVLHVTLSMPWLFQWRIQEYWPYVAMVICFIGVGVSQMLAKRNLEVLAAPLFNTAAALPIATTICYFAVGSTVDPSSLMLVAGSLYLMIGIVTDSMLSKVLALVFGNLALWMFYGHFERLSFMAHPQWWLIPPAISALLAAQLNRRYLSQSQLAAIRYVGAAVIYISSTSEIFISGLGDKLWPPMVLAFLSVVGMLAGMMLQVRAFLYFGTLFLLMAMLTMVSHAHRQFNHVWPWWAFGIAMGIGILILFGLFEKQKQKMRGLTERLKNWDA